jgi:hypothetical protein
LNQIEDSLPSGFVVHLVMDNYGCTWWNGCSPSCLSGAVRRGSHTSVKALEKAMLDYLDQRNDGSKPFVRTADADLMLGKVQRLCERISRSGR